MNEHYNNKNISSLFWFSSFFRKSFFFTFNSLSGAFFLLKSVSNFTEVCRIMVVDDDVCWLYLCRFAGFRGVSATPTPQISWRKTTSARFRLLCHLLSTKSNKHIMLTPAYGFVNAEKAY